MNLIPSLNGFEIDAGPEIPGAFDEVISFEPVTGIIKIPENTPDPEGVCPEDLEPWDIDSDFPMENYCATGIPHSPCDPMPISVDIPCYTTVYVDSLPEEGIQGIMYVVPNEDKYAVYMWDGEQFNAVTSSSILQALTVNPSTSAQDILPEQGYDGFSSVHVNAVPEGDLDVYVFFNGRTATAIVTATQAGYIDSSDTFTGTANMGLALFGVANISYVGGRLVVDDVIAHSGYISTSDSHQISIILSDYLPTEAGKTVTPTTSEQVAVDANKWTTGQIKVGPIPPEYIVPTGTKQITSNGNAQDVAAYEKVNVNVPNSYAAADEGKVVQSGTLVSQSSQTVTENGTYDTTTKNEVVVNVSGGGGSIGGLANMADVETQDYQLAYMLMCMKKGQTAGGTVTYTQAFANSETKILSTGLTAIHGLLFVGTDQNLHVNGGNAQSSKWVLITVDESGNYNAIGTMSQTAASANTNQLFNITQGTNADAVPVNGALRFDGGDVYYKGRYNKNANYQLIVPNKQYDWLAW